VKGRFGGIAAWAKIDPNGSKTATAFGINDAMTEVTSTIRRICLDPKSAVAAHHERHVAAEGASGEPIAPPPQSKTDGINALAIDQKLEFAKDGLTVIYGTTGPAKSATCAWLNTLSDAGSRHKFSGMSRIRRDATNR